MFICYFLFLFFLIFIYLFTLGPHTPIILVATQIEKRIEEGIKCFSTQEGLTLAKSLKNVIAYREVSAQRIIGVNQIFELTYICGSCPEAAEKAARALKKRKIEKEKRKRRGTRRT